jgi:predicted metal-binding membrane protein
MSATNNLVTPYRNALCSMVRIRMFFIQRPEWWTYALSIVVWIWLMFHLSSANQALNHSENIRYCIPTEFQAIEHPTYQKNFTFKEKASINRIGKIMVSGLKHWIIMVIAMMFPLLTEPIRHVAFSVRRKDKALGILSFLIGYMITWIVAGLFFLLVPFLLNALIGNVSPFVNALIKASGFLMAAILIWQPSRLVRMTKCGRTMPLRIDGWRLYLDSIRYGLKMGLACLNMCWVVMAALVLAQHSIVLMYLVTIVLIYERYLVPHTSKFPGYAWVAIAFALFVMEIGV